MKWLTALILLAAVGLGAGAGWRSYVLEERIKEVEKRIEAVKKLAEEEKMAAREVGAGTDRGVVETAERAFEGITAEEVLELVDEELNKRLGQLTETKKQEAGEEEAKEREYFVPLGSGMTKSRSWERLDSARAVVDMSRYGKVKEVVFEASLKAQNGNVWARLAEADGSWVYYESVISHNNQTATWKQSQPLLIGGGVRNLVVEVKSDSGEPGTMEAARLKIVGEQ